MYANFPRNDVCEGASLWLDSREIRNSRAMYLKPRTVKTYRLELEALTLFFDDTRLCDITNERIRAYQERRSDGLPPFKHQRHFDHINGEIGKLQKILMRANLWQLIADEYEPLNSPLEEPRRVMTKKEEAHLFAVAASRPEFAFIYAYCLLSLEHERFGRRAARLTSGLSMRDAVIS